jgi:integrase
LKRTKIIDALEHYYQSLDYRLLSVSAQKDYRYCFNTFLASVVRGKNVSRMSLQAIDTPRAQALYNRWAERGVPFANHTHAVVNKLYNYSIQLGYAEFNPFSKVSKRKHKPRKVVWSREDVQQFLNTAYSRFKWRSVGLIVQMAYEWCQRLGDMANLKWENYDENARVLYLEQSKRRARVELPTSDALHEMLMEQKADVDFQPYIAPMCRQDRITSKPYDKHYLSVVGRAIIKAAGLPDEYQIMDMRRTGTVEMVDAGVSMPQIMAVTGHANPQSVKPYMKNTLTSAVNAAKLRFNTAGDTYTHNQEGEVHEQLL